MTRERMYAPVSPPIALTIAGSDSGGGAGIQADLKTMEAHGVFGTSVLTAVTAQNTRGVESSHVLPIPEIRAQYEAVVADFAVGAVKTGMLATREVIETVTDLLAPFDGPVVVDPVMVATAGDRLLTEAAESAYEDLIAEATLVTPNVDEAEVLAGVDVDDEADAEAAAREILAMGADAVLLKGGHLGGEQVVDTLVHETGPGIEVARFAHARVDTDATHGSGCTLSSAIAARIAHGDDLEDAVDAGIAFMGRAVRYGLDVGRGPGSVHHMVGLRERAGRSDATEAVADLVDRFVAANVRPLIPEVGMNVAGASPYAESTAEIAAVEGRITRTRSGVRASGGVRLGGSSHVAAFLLAAREHDPDLRFAINCRFDDDIADALDALAGEVVAVDPSPHPAAVAGGNDAAETDAPTADVARQAFDGTSPVAVVDRGAPGKEPMARLVATDPDTLAERTLTLLDALEE